MSNKLGQIAAAIADYLKTQLADVDQASADDYLPGVATQTAAVIVPIFGTTSTFDIFSFDESKLYEAHRIPVEIWVKHTGQIAATQARARRLTGGAVLALRQAGTLGGLIDTIGYFDGEKFDTGITAEVAEEPITANEVAYVLISLSVPVTAFS